MADRKITELSAMSAGSQATGDLVTIVDVSESAAADKNKKMTMENLFKGIPGDVGIGTSSPSTKLHISDASAPEFRIVDTTNNCTGFLRPVDTSVRFGTGSNHPLEFHINSAEKARIDSSGRLLVGTTSAFESGTDTIVQGLQTSGARIALGRNDSSVSSGNTIGQLNFYGNATSGTYSQVARIKSLADGTHSGTSRPTSLVFETTASSATTSSEAMRIDSSGNVGIGTTSPAELLEIQDGHISVGSSTNTTSTNTLISGYGYVLGGSKFGNVSIRSSYVNTTNAAGLEFYVASPTVSEAMRIASSGNVGIGTSSPAYGLHVNNTVTVQNNVLRVFNNALTAGLTVFAPGVSGNWAESTGFALASDAGTAPIGFLQGASHRMRIASSGNVGINVTSPDRKLEVVDTNSNGSYPLAVSNFIDATANRGAAIDFRLTTGGNTRGELGCKWNSNSSSDGTHFYFAPNDGTTGNIQKLRIDNDGLKFGSDTAAANALEDYEEGTFNLRLNNTADDATFTFTGNQGYYVKIGSEVHFQVYIFGITCTNTGTTTNSRLYGLPFNAGSNSNQYAPCLIMHNNALSNVTAGYVNINSSFIVPMQHLSVNIGLITTMSSKSMMVAGSYRTV